MFRENFSPHCGLSEPCALQAKVKQMRIAKVIVGKRIFERTGFLLVFIFDKVDGCNLSKKCQVKSNGSFSNSA